MVRTQHAQQDVERLCKTGVEDVDITQLSAHVLVLARVDSPLVRREALPGRQRCPERKHQVLLQGHLCRVLNRLHEVVVHVAEDIVRALERERAVDCSTEARHVEVGARLRGDCDAR